MEKRTTLRAIPNKDSYLQITDNSSRVWHFKVPSALQGMKVLKSSQSLITAMSQLQGGDMLSILNMAKEAGPEVLSAFGAVIGISWYSDSYDLVSKRADFKNLMDYGEAVYEELHEEDLALEDIILMAVAVARIWWDKNSIQEEAMERLGFTSPKKEEKASLSLTSESTTSETLGDSLS